MSVARSHPLLFEADRQLCEETLDRFEAAWQSEVPPSIAAFLPPPHDAEREYVLWELVKIDLEYRWKRGERACAETYREQFPELGESTRFPNALLAEEQRIRIALGEPVTDAELAARFPGRWGELRELLLNFAAGDFTNKDTDSQHDTMSLLSNHVRERAPQFVSWLATGRLGRYELLEQVGRGGFGAVFRARDNELGRDVAIKVPHPELADDPELRARLLKEARSAAQLRHPGIVPIHEVGQHQGCPYIVYEYLAGHTLSQRLRQEPPAPQQAAEWVLRVAEALDHAHARGVIHRDLKPSNIVFDQDDQPIVTDFGLAMYDEAGASLTIEGDILGTPAYMPPEQASGLGHAADARSDVYSLGVVLYELLCGRTPFQGNPASVLHKVIHQDPPEPRSVANSVPPDLETICLKAMAKQPRCRYASARALADDLQCYVNRQPIRARRNGLRRRVTRWMNRHPAITASAASVTIVLAVTYIALSVLPRNSRAARTTAEEAPHVAVSVAATMPASTELLISSYEPDNLDIVILDDDGNVIKNLTSHPALDSGAAWSPDGQRIAFHSNRSGKKCIWVMDADGDNLKQLTSVITELGDENPAWSPDARRIAFARILSFSTNEEHGYASDIMVMDADGSNLAQLTKESAANFDAAWSPDGERIAFTSTRATRQGYRLYSMDADGRNVKMLTTTDNKYGCVFPAWSPDGERLAYSDLIGGYVELFIRDMATGASRQVTELFGVSSAAAWSPGGRQIAFQHYSNGRCILYVVDADGGNLKPLTIEQRPFPGVDRRPVWRPSPSLAHGLFGPNLAD